MQPNAEATRRRKNLTPKTATPITNSTPTTSALAATVSSDTKIRYPYKPKDNLPDIYAKFTQQLREVEADDDEVDESLRLGENSKILEIIRNSPIVAELPATSAAVLEKVTTSKTRRTLFNYFTPVTLDKSSSQSSDASDVTIPETQEVVAKSITLSQVVTPVSTPVRLTRRNSMTFKTQTLPETAEPAVITKTPTRFSRRNSFTTPATPTATPAKTPRNTKRKTIFPSVEEEPSSDSSNMNLTNIQSNTKQPTIEQRTTCYAPKNMEVTKTPSPLDSLNEIMITPLGRQRSDTLLSSVLRRKTMYTPQTMQETFVEQSTQPEHSTPTTLSVVSTENGPEEVSKPAQISRRRTLFTPNRVVAFKRDRILEQDQLLNNTLESALGKFYGKMFCYVMC